MKVQDEADDSENADIAAVQETADVQPWQRSEGDPGSEERSSDKKGEDALEEEAKSFTSQEC